MGKHSKNKCSRPYIGSNERRSMQDGTQTVRLDSESMRPFDACCLCLKPAYKPTCSRYGFLYCYECILNNLMQQKKTNKKKLLEMEEKKVENQIKSIVQLEEQQKKELEKKLDVLSVNNSSIITTGSTISSSTNALFWVPQEKTPQEIKIKKLKCLDPMNPSGVLKLKDLVRIEFALTKKCEEDGELTPQFNVRYKCPACDKTFTNACKGCNVIRECHHAICSNCFDRFCKGSNECFVCQKKIKKVISLNCAGLAYSHNDSNREKVVATSYTPTMNIS